MRISSPLAAALFLCASAAAADPLPTPESAPKTRRPAEPLPPAPRPPAPPPARAPVRTAQTTVTAAPVEAPAPPPQEAPPAVDERFAGAVLLGYASDNLNLGVGARFGKTLASRVYLGGTFVYNFGESESVATPAGTSTASFSAFYVGPEGGYDFALGAFVVRPYVGLGIASLSVSGSAAGTSVGASTTKLVLWPGGAAIYDLPGSDFFVGGDARLVTVPGGPAFGVVAFGGMHFGS
jgi:hypothetical protein